MSLRWGTFPVQAMSRLADLDSIAPALDPGNLIVAYCRGPYCIYAHQAVMALRKRGLQARRLEGGLPEWRAEGRLVHA